MGHRSGVSLPSPSCQQTRVGFGPKYITRPTIGADADSGPGLSAEQHDRIFETFYTTKPNGTGLGLAVTKTLLERMGASIDVNDRSACDGHAAGACFRISLPAGEPR